MHENFLSPTRLTQRRSKAIDAAVGSASSYTESLAGASEQLLKRRVLKA